MHLNKKAGENGVILFRWKLEGRNIVLALMVCIRYNTHAFPCDMREGSFYDFGRFKIFFVTYHVRILSAVFVNLNASISSRIQNILSNSDSKSQKSPDLI